MARVECGGGDVSSSKEVKIRVKTGWNGVHPLKSLRALHDKTANFNVGMTWVDAFQLKFGVTVDKDRFLIMRGQRGGGPSPVRHSLLEKISVLIGDFEGKHPEVYKVFIVTNAVYGNIKQEKVSVPMRMLTPAPEPTPTSSKAPAPALGVSSRIFANRGVRIKVEAKGPPDVECSRSKRESTILNSIATRNVLSRSIKVEKVIVPMSAPIPMPKLTPAPTPTSSKAPSLGVSSRIFANRGVNINVEAKGPPDIGCSPSKRESTNVNSIAIRNAIIENENAPARKRKWTPPVRAPTPTPPTTTTSRASSPEVLWLDDCLREYNESCGVYEVDNVEADDEDDGLDFDDDDDSDLCSETSTQDSQDGYLRDLGIVNEDIRTGFVTDAKRNFTNTQFLLARHELLMLKTNKRKWSRWMIAAPHTTNIVREILDI